MHPAKRSALAEVNYPLRDEHINQHRGGGGPLGEIAFSSKSVRD